MGTDKHARKSDEGDNRPGDPAGPGIQDLKERCKCRSIGCMVRRKTKQCPAAAWLDLSGFGDGPAGPNPLKNPFELSADEIGESNRPS